MSRTPRTFLCALVLTTGLAVTTSAQVIINLSSVIGPPGTDAATVAGNGNAVNFVGFASDFGATTLTAAGSSASSSFDFNAGFADHQDRATGSNPNAGAAHVFADRKYDSGTPGPLIVDLNNDGSFADEIVQSGFGMHSDGFVTFDLDVIRANAGLAAGTPLLLTGQAGLANANAVTSGAIVADNLELAVFDWTGSAGGMINSYSLNLSGSVRFVTFIGLSGLDLSDPFAHVGYTNVQLVAVPEPSALALVTLGSVAIAVRSGRRRA